jgi:hypothetical protein
MSIRALAQDFYRSVKRLEELEKRLRQTALTPADRAALQQEIRKACAERDQLKAMLEGAKDGPG